MTLAFGSCPRDRGAEAAAPLQQPMVTGESAATDAFTQSRRFGPTTLLDSFILLTEGFKPASASLRGHGNSVIGEATCRLVQSCPPAAVCLLVHEN